MKSYDTFKLLTTKIEAVGKDGLSVGTGFFTNAAINDKPETVIVTVRHVMRERRSYTLTCITDRREANKQRQSESAANQSGRGDNDLCCCRLEEMNEIMKRATGSPVYYTALSEDGIVTEEEAEEIDVLKEVFMIGYPAEYRALPWNIRY